MTRLRTLMAGAVLAFALVPFTAQPAQACFSIPCIVDCVENIVGGKPVCRL